MEEIIYSIIIPHKNSIDLLKRCVESIPNRRDLEIIIVDDNSDSVNLERSELNKWLPMNAKLIIP